jgi:hypothetical protein
MAQQRVVVRPGWFLPPCDGDAVHGPGTTISSAFSGFIAFRPFSLLSCWLRVMDGRNSVLRPIDFSSSGYFAAFSLLFLLEAARYFLVSLVVGRFLARSPSLLKVFSSVVSLVPVHGAFSPPEL